MTELVAKTRNLSGKKAKLMRKDGDVPAVVYGYGEDPVSLSVEAKTFSKIWKEVGESSILSLNVEGGKIYNVLIHDVDMNPLTDSPQHIDFYAVRMDRPIEATVPIEFIGEANAVKALGGILVKVIHELHVRALPKDLPHELIGDLSILEALEDQLLVKNISVPQGVEVFAEEDQVIALVEAPRSEEELAALEETPADVSLENIEVTGKKEKDEEGEGSSAEVKE